MENKNLGNDGLVIKKRHLPHWMLKGATYFVTFRVKSDEMDVEEQKFTLEHIKSGNKKFYLLIAAIVMPDHVHVLFTPDEAQNLTSVMKGMKGSSARKINLKRNTTGTIWQDESFDQIVMNQNELDKKIEYMFNNPVKKGLTQDPWNYHGWYLNTEKTF